MPKAIVASSSRKYVKILTKQNNIIPGVIASKDISALVGDNVDYEMQVEKNEVLVNKIYPRKNLLSRSSASKTKELASNVDLLILVTAPKPLFNKSFLDRTIAAAVSQKIPILIAVNKSDLKEEILTTEEEITIYKKVGFPVVYCNTIENDGLVELEKNLMQANIVCLLGVSGVGKSSIINKLCPEQEIRVDDVSFTGQGKQTTTVAHAYRYPKNPNLLLVDLPGIQNFGTSHLTKNDILNSFPEILDAVKFCKFSDCSHNSEPGCYVRKLLETQKIAENRLKSYQEMLEEIKIVY